MEERLQEGLQTFLGILISGILSGCLEMYYQKIMHPDMILNRWRLLLQKMPKFLFKPLGGCFVCNGTWMSIFCSYALYGLNYYILIGSIGISYIVEQLIHNFTDSVYVNQLKKKQL